MAKHLREHCSPYNIESRQGLTYPNIPVLLCTLSWKSDGKGLTPRDLRRIGLPTIVAYRVQNYNTGLVSKLLSGSKMFAVEDALINDLEAYYLPGTDSGVICGIVDIKIKLCTDAEVDGDNSIDDTVDGELEIEGLTEDDRYSDYFDTDEQEDVFVPDESEF